MSAGKPDVLPVAERFVGWVREHGGANDGPWVEAIQRVTGNKRGDPWCASFVAFVLAIAYRGAPPLPPTASCDALLAYARRHQLLVEEPEPGDVFLVMRTPDDAIHTGFVAEVLDRHVILAIEGNTNPKGGREGYGVFRRKRARANLAFIRVPELQGLAALASAAPSEVAP